MRRADSLREEFGDDDRILARQRKVNAPSGLSCERCGDDLVAEADGHAQVADVEIQVVVAVDVGDGRPGTAIDVDRRGPIEARHPRHRYPVRQVGARPGTPGRGCRGTLDEIRVLGGTQLGEPATIDVRDSRVPELIRLPVVVPRHLSDGM